MVKERYKFKQYNVNRNNKMLAFVINAGYEGSGHCIKNLHLITHVMCFVF